MFNALSIDYKPNPSIDNVEHCFVWSPQMSNSIYNNNANVELGTVPVVTDLRPASKVSRSGSVDNLTSIYESVIYLGIP